MDEFIVTCDGKQTVFNSVADLSNGINDITKKYFTVKNIYRIGETIWLCGFDGTFNDLYMEHTLSIKGTYTFHPYVVLDYRGNKIAENMFLDLQNIASLKIYSYDHNVAENISKIKCNEPNIALFNDRPISYCARALLPTIKFSDCFKVMALILFWKYICKNII